MEKEVKKGIGKNISIFRKRKGLSQKELADKIGIGLTNISYIENGKYTPRLNTLLKMSKIFEVELYEFFIFDSHIEKEKIQEHLLKAIDDDEVLLRLIFRIYCAIKTDYSKSK